MFYEITQIPTICLDRYFIYLDRFKLANNRAQEYWAFSAPAPEPYFDPAGVTTPAPLPVHNI